MIKAKYCTEYDMWCDEVEENVEKDKIKCDIDCDDCDCCEIIKI